MRASTWWQCPARKLHIQAHPLDPNDARYPAMACCGQRIQGGEDPPWVLYTAASPLPSLPYCEKMPSEWEGP